MNGWLAKWWAKDWRKSDGKPVEILPARQICGVTSKPITIAEAYRAWVAINAECNAAVDLDDEAAGQLARAQYALENGAAEMPTITPGDVWKLWAMASPDFYGDSAFTNALCARARKEARAVAALEEVRA